MLNGDTSARAAPETKKRIVDAAAALGYVANAAARQLRESRTGLLGLVVHDLSSPIYVEVLAGARAEAEKNGYFLLLGDADELMTNPATFRALVEARRVDGILIQAGHSDFDKRIGDVAAHVPTVVFNAPMHDSAVDVSGVYADEVGAARLLTEHLLVRGHRRIGFLSGPRDSSTSHLRLAGFRAALDEAGVDDDAFVFYGDWTAATGAAGVHEALAQSRPPTAVIAGNTLIGLGALSEATSLAVKVPDDLAVAAIHDAWFADYLAPTLTTVALPLRELGATAVRTLLAGGTPSDVVVGTPAPVVVVRAST
ncbi:LacI family transcriptional regulator [Frondihabitans sucicola]|uniref:LacI family transcriptional regulator n=1 Tax=Frondihabitans sucicola TaxID=1268041 RepID=A0ABM8GMF0_9MICO|nr:LacI family DNA-binding transcriptional regulator [Frondihabitans sucicola]BDZ49599.1 LacI family transcriptional regulator [Frondihabitans sucicola]